MKKFIILLLISIFTTKNMKAGDIPLIYSNGETFEKVLVLPNSEDFEFIYSDRLYHGDLGIKYNQFCLFWIPLFNYGEKRYVLYNERKDDYVYVELNASHIRALQKIYGNSLVPTLPKPSFWNEWGGKLLALLIIICGWGLFSPDHKEEKSETIKKK